MLRRGPNILPGTVQAMDTSRRPWVPLIAVALGYFMVILDATAVAGSLLTGPASLARGWRRQRVHVP